ncbi:Pleckstrin homology domain-containing protein [Mycena sanguinolenta]|nr:Pleckstrin homology domain-containing protein [Mycena sanguinolenta]
MPPIPTIVEPEPVSVPPPLAKSQSASGNSKKSFRAAGLETGSHLHKRVFVGPLPEKAVPLPDAAPGKGKKKRRLRLGPADDEEDGHISRIIREHAFAFFIQEGGKEEDWEETREQSVREEMLRRWRETEWGAIWGRREKEPKASKRWIGGSFEVGDILGINILQEPAESIRERMSNRSARSASRKTDASSSYQYLSMNEGASTFFAPDQSTSFSAAETPGGSILRPTLSVGAVNDEGRRVQSEFAVRPTLDTTPQVKSDSHLPAIGKERERVVHYAQSPVRDDSEGSPAPPSEVLERSPSELLATSAEAMSTPEPPKQLPGGVVMRDRMLVRVGYTESESIGPVFDEETSRKTRGIRYQEWAEFIVVWRNKSIHFYEPHNVPGTKWLTGSKYRLAFIVPLKSAKTRLSLYSFVDLTWSLTCTPTSIHHDSKARAIFRRAKEGTNIFICKVKSRSRAADWMWTIWRRLGGLLPPSLEILHPDLGTRVKMELPGVEAPEMFTRENIVALCMHSLRRVKDWKELIDLQLSEGKEFQLTWRLGTQLDWVWLETDVLGEPRECAVLCGLAMHQSVPSPHLELRLAQHSAHHLVLKNEMRVPEPPSIEGYLERIRPNSQSKHLMYLVTHDGNLFSLAAEKAHPPSPMGIGQAESAGALRLAEVQRGTRQILGATGVSDMRSILSVRRAFQPVVPASHDMADVGDNQSYVSRASVIERSDSDDEDGGGEDGLRTAQDKTHLRMKRSFELLLKNGHIIRFEAHSRKVALEWIERLRALIGYWRQRHRIDASEEMDLAQAYRPRLTKRRHVLRNDSEIAPEAPVDASAPMPLLSNIYSWCVLDGCKPVIRGGKVHMRRGLHGQYRFVQLFLLPGHLAQFRIMPGTALHLAMNQNINLADAYVCSGYFAALTLPTGEHISDNPLPRRYADGLECDDPDEDTLFMLWYHPNRTAVNVALEVPDDAVKQQTDNAMSTRIPSLSSKRKVAVFRCRNKLERDAWCWALNCEIEKIVRVQQDREEKLRNTGGSFG